MKKSEMLSALKRDLAYAFDRISVTDSQEAMFSKLAKSLLSSVEGCGMEPPAFRWYHTNSRGERLDHPENGSYVSRWEDEKPKATPLTPTAREGYFTLSTPEAPDEQPRPYIPVPTPSTGTGLAGLFRETYDYVTLERAVGTPVTNTVPTNAYSQAVTLGAQHGVTYGEAMQARAGVNEIRYTGQTPTMTVTGVDTVTGTVTMTAGRTDSITTYARNVQLAAAQRPDAFHTDTNPIQSAVEAAERRIAQMQQATGEPRLMLDPERYRDRAVELNTNTLQGVTLEHTFIDEDGEDDRPFVADPEAHETEDFG